MLIFTVKNKQWKSQAWNKSAYVYKMRLAIKLNRETVYSLNFWIYFSYKIQQQFGINIMFMSSAYGSVYKAIHKESGEVLAIKQVPVDTDLQEIIKEISIMQQCDRWG